MLVLGGIGDSVRRVAERSAPSQKAAPEFALMLLLSAELSYGYDAYTPLDILAWNKQ